MLAKEPSNKDDRYTFNHKESYKSCVWRQFIGQDVGPTERWKKMSYDPRSTRGFAGPKILVLLGEVELAG